MRRFPHCPSARVRGITVGSRKAHLQDGSISLFEPIYHQDITTNFIRSHATSRVADLSCYIREKIFLEESCKRTTAKRTHWNYQSFLPQVRFSFGQFMSKYFNIVSLVRGICYFSVTKDIVRNDFASNKLVVGNSVKFSIGFGNREQNLHFNRLKSTQNSAKMSSNAHDDTKYEPREISFETPYGHLACLEWGQREAPNKILCVHGWLDNAGSFEPLMPYILKHRNNYSKYHVVSMDMPGVGHSSHRPPSAEYTVFSNIIEMRRVTQQLGWHQNVTLLGHSYGGHLSFLYSCIYPKQVSSMISIDTTHPITHQAANWHVNIGNSIEHYFKCEYYGRASEKLDAVTPVYTEESAIKRLMEAHNSSLTLEAAKVMFKRGATKHPNGSCTFNRDVRHRHMSVEFRPDDDLMLKFLEHTFKPTNLMIIRALGSPYHRPEKMRLRYYDLFQRNCTLFRDIMLDGTHHLHMNTPDLVATEINKFLNDAETHDGESTGRPLVSKPNL